MTTSSLSLFSRFWRSDGKITSIQTQLNLQVPLKTRCVETGLEGASGNNVVRIFELSVT